MSEPRRVIVYHHNCHDGITALWCAKRLWRGHTKQLWADAEPYPGRYDEAPDLERLRGADVLVLDFSWKRQDMLKVYEVARSLRVLDHHKTAQAELDGLDFVTFDMERSGAGLAWDELIGGPRPPLVDYVEDRDLWRFKLPHSREVHAASSSYPLTYEARALLMQRSIDDLVAEGGAVLRYHDRLVKEAAEHAIQGTIAGHTVPMLACPCIALASDLGNTLAMGYPFAAVYVDRPDGSRVYQLRSTPEGLDVGAIAASMGGGGHRHAAGFTAK